VNKFVCFLKKKLNLEQESSSIGPEVDVNFAEMEAPRNRAGSITCTDDVRADGKDQKMENVLYDKYLANFFNPLHAKPTGEGIAPEASSRSKGVLYDVDGKFAYSTYSEEMRSYHPMLDIKALTKDLK